MRRSKVRRQGDEEHGDRFILFVSRRHVGWRQARRNRQS